MFFPFGKIIWKFILTDDLQLHFMILFLLCMTRKDNLKVHQVKVQVTWNKKRQIDGLIIMYVCHFHVCCPSQCGEEEGWGGVGWGRISSLRLVEANPILEWLYYSGKETWCNQNCFCLKKWPKTWGFTNLK